jgi:hypothetical protein
VPLPDARPVEQKKPKRSRRHAERS